MQKALLGKRKVGSKAYLSAITGVRRVFKKENFGFFFPCLDPLGASTLPPPFYVSIRI